MKADGRLYNSCKCLYFPFDIEKCHYPNNRSLRLMIFFRTYILGIKAFLLWWLDPLPHGSVTDENKHIKTAVWNSLVCFLYIAATDITFSSDVGMSWCYMVSVSVGLGAVVVVSLSIPCGCVLVAWRNVYAYMNMRVLTNDAWGASPLSWTFTYNATIHRRCRRVFLPFIATPYSSCWNCESRPSACRVGSGTADCLG